MLVRLLIAILLGWLTMFVLEKMGVEPPTPVVVGVLVGVVAFISGISIA